MWYGVLIFLSGPFFFLILSKVYIIAILIPNNIIRLTVKVETYKSDNMYLTLFS